MNLIAFILALAAIFFFVLEGALVRGRLNFAALGLVFFVAAWVTQHITTDHPVHL